MIVQTDSVCSSEEERENYDNMKAEIQLTTSLIKNENTCYIWVFASTMLSRNPVPSHIRSLHNFLKRLYFVSLLWFSRHKTHRFYIEKSWVLLSPPPIIMIWVAFTHRQIPGFLICKTMESDCIFSVPTSHLVKGFLRNWLVSFQRFWLLLLLKASGSSLEPHSAIPLSPALQPPFAIASAFKAPIVRRPRREVDHGVVGGGRGGRGEGKVAVQVWGMGGTEGEETEIGMLNKF